MEIMSLTNLTAEISSEDRVQRVDAFRSSELGHERCKGAQYVKCESEKIVAKSNGGDHVAHQSNDGD